MLKDCWLFVVVLRMHNQLWHEMDANRFIVPDTRCTNYYCDRKWRSIDWLRCIDVVQKRNKSGEPQNSDRGTRTRNKSVIALAYAWISVSSYSIQFKFAVHCFSLTGQFTVQMNSRFSRCKLSTLALNKKMQMREWVIKQCGKLSSGQSSECKSWQSNWLIVLSV